MDKQTLKNYSFECFNAYEELVINLNLELAVKMADKALLYLARIQNKLIKLNIIEKKHTLRRGIIINFGALENLYNVLTDYDKKENSENSYYLMSFVGNLIHLLDRVAQHYTLL